MNNKTLLIGLLCLGTLGFGGVLIAQQKMIRVKGSDTLVNLVLGRTIKDHIEEMRRESEAKPREE